ncbi:cell wall-active antibiotics response protein LiaF [Lacticaseibacillus daqingensis]|uniref:cell wall-active antibiotics response protein LiaF n=1 Tax=Lacticaseibacillus daqingensis TaxID=2486014 RepID=UPI000F786FC2|nr:cell wall-active antibiotics response protein LiaF [Lacticaseibacillus daqingensis]
MKRRWQIFWLIELVLLLLLGYQTVSNPTSLIEVLFGAGALLLGVKGRFWHTFWLTIGTVLLVVAVFINPIVWVMLFVALLGLLSLFSGRQHDRIVPWAKKQYVAVRTKEPSAKAGTRRRHTWIGDEAIGTSVYEWDDINMTVAAGDTIIDLGNTLLPQGDSTVVIRKGFGKTRVLVPVGVGVLVDHSAVFGELTLDGVELALHNEAVKHFSPDYDTATRRVHIITNVIVGDLEVLSV